MYQVIIVIHVLLGLGVIGLVLMQQGKGADAGAAFGSGSAGSVFGAQGAASFLSRSTAILATLFFATSLGLAVANGHRGSETDLMTTPAAEQDNSGLPAVEGAKTAEVMSPVVAPVSKETPVLPAVPVPHDQAIGTAVDAPKTVEEAKPAEEKKQTDTVQKKSVVKEEHKVIKDKKADAHKGKDVKKDH